MELILFVRSPHFVCMCVDMFACVHVCVCVWVVESVGWFASARSRGAGAWPLTTSLTLHFLKVFSVDLSFGVLFLYTRMHVCTYACTCVYLYVCVP